MKGILSGQKFAASFYVLFFKMLLVAVVSKNDFLAPASEMNFFARGKWFLVVVSLKMKMGPEKGPLSRV